MPLLRIALLDRRFDFRLDRGQVERGWVLHRWEINGSFPQLQHNLLDEDKPESLPAEELVEPCRGTLEEVQNRRSLEGVLANVVDFGHICFDLRSRPAFRLVVELVLKVVYPHSAKLRPSEVVNLMASGWPFALKHGHLVISIEVVLVGPVAELYALE